MRKIIINEFFNHQGFPEAKVFINNKEKNYNITEANNILGFIINLVDASIKMIEYGHADSYFLDCSIKFSAYVLLVNSGEYLKEFAEKETSLSKGIWIIRLLEKCHKLRGCKKTIESLIISVWNLLTIINKSRLNRQILVFLQLFKNFVINNEAPDVGSYIETFTKDFEAIFKLHPFVIEKPHLYAEEPKAVKEVEEVKEEDKENDSYESKDSDIHEVNSDEEAAK